MNALAARRRHPAVLTVLLLVALVATGCAYAAFAPKPAQAATADADQVAQGKKLFQANCATCHGLNGEGTKTGTGDQIAGPPLAGVGAAAVDFQVGTGRMPMAAPGVQAAQGVKGAQFTQTQIDQLAAYVASLGPGPAIPAAADYDYSNADAAKGGELFRVNCAMCHNFAGSGGALTRGKYAPSLATVSPKHIYEILNTGSQAMPVFNDTNLSPDSKREIIAYIKTIHTEPSPGGLKLGSMGPVSEGLFAWVFGLALLIGFAVWLGNKSA
ncbi:Menaquinol-cytochrome c reductase cytochrome c subunit [Nostocoides japonicum T1-X7]|uniref:Cytochrome bc1 complex cytochrome c subunit n=1 Tax=Nostocoides japonicum T1-X7 TaxID=1194083 RepID=A0A077M1C1_9MICO|nr:c-type cytochrome [Tetrasphaera japonica]CCH80123.1 Menaquinol-cytochrome c reductase cytochrome c subunit [Tetrasphaera japonica T1-X7]